MNIVISPHVDDAIFSLGTYLQHQDDLLIVSPLAGIPKDPIGKKKHTTLRAEHKLACKKLGVGYLSGDFLDDVYGADEDELKKWLLKLKYDSIYIPLGIHHPDHIMVSDIMMDIVDVSKNVYFYEELPYRVLYPELTITRLELVMGQFGPLEEYVIKSSNLKGDLVRIYRSQTKSDELLEMLATDEHLWGLA